MADIRTPSAVIDALGGPTAVAKIFGFDDRVVYNWRAMDKLPARSFVGLQSALRARGLTAPDEIWNMAAPVPGFASALPSLPSHDSDLPKVASAHA